MFPSDQDLGLLPNANLDPDIFRTEFVKLADLKCFLYCSFAGTFGSVRFLYFLLCHKKMFKSLLTYVDVS